MILTTVPLALEKELGICLDASHLCKIQDSRFKMIQDGLKIQNDSRRIQDSGARYRWERDGSSRAEAPHLFETRLQIEFFGFARTCAWSLTG